MTKKQAQQLTQILLKDTSCDMLSKILIAHVLHMPKGGKNYYECVSVVIEFLEEAIPAHPGAFAMYFKILDLMPAPALRSIPDGMKAFVAENIEEIEKYFEGPIPEKYRPSKLILPSKTLVDAQGVVLEPSNFEVGQKFEGSIEDACANPPTLKLV